MCVGINGNKANHTIDSVGHDAYHSTDHHRDNYKLEDDNSVYRDCGDKHLTPKNYVDREENNNHGDGRSLIPEICTYSASDEYEEPQ
ncbi:hypothetical protein K7432_013888 [Basidiobolus ranarum]|uniref:Uncharacterized protein n=1 Tax=Basidiobolus ranarum TaxID=34480 RepID=A0ABR2WIN4_9FUNG